MRRTLSYTSLFTCGAMNWGMRLSELAFTCCTENPSREPEIRDQARSTSIEKNLKIYATFVVDVRLEVYALILGLGASESEI